MKIKLQSGGVAYIPTTNQIGAAQQETGAASSESTGKVPGFTKEIIDLIKENGIETDVNMFLNKVGNILDMANDPTGEHLTMREILKIQKLANSVKQNHAAYQTAEKSLEAQDAWGDVAVTARGWIYTQNIETKEIQELSPQQFLENQDKYVALTNAELMNIRRRNPAMSFDYAILDNLSAAVGMKTIVDYVESVIQKFGTTTITGYSEKQSNAIRSGLDHIVAGDLGNYSGIMVGGPDGVYKISQESTIVDTGIEAALNYLIKTLPNTYKNALTAKAAAEGYDDRLMLLQMLSANSSRKITADFDKQATEERLGGAGSTAAAKLDDHDTYLMRIATGGEWEVVNIMPNPDNPMQFASMQALASNVGPLVDKDMNQLQIANLNVIMENLKAAEASKSKDITFGNRLLNLGERGALMWDGESQLTDIWLPYTTEGGRIKPDFDKLERFNEFNDKVKGNPNISSMEKVLLLRECGINPNEIEPDPVTGGYKFKDSVMKLFLSFSAVTSENNLDLSDNDKKWLQHLDKDTGARLSSLYSNAVKYNTIQRNKSAKVVNSEMSDAKKRKMYRGNIYMPIDSEYLALHMSTNQNISKSELTNFAQRTQATAYVNQLRNEDYSKIGQFN